MSNSIATAKIAIRLWALELARQKVQGASIREETASLGAQFGTAMRRQQGANLISHIYELSGNGTLPVSGGKIELKKPGKLFKDS